MDLKLHVEALEALVHKMKKEIIDQDATNSCLFDESVALAEIGYKLDPHNFKILLNESNRLSEKQKHDIIDLAEEPE
jgi:hypothetical protein